MISPFIHGYAAVDDSEVDGVSGDEVLVPVCIRKSEVTHWEGYWKDPGTTLVFMRSGKHTSIDMEHREFTRRMEEVQEPDFTKDSDANKGQ